MAMLRVLAFALLMGAPVLAQSLTYGVGRTPTAERNSFSPISSVMVMNSAGDIRPSFGCSQRANDSKPAMVRSSSRTIGW